MHGRGTDFHDPAAFTSTANFQLSHLGLPSARTTCFLGYGRAIALGKLVVEMVAAVITKLRRRRRRRRERIEGGEAMGCRIKCELQVGERKRVEIYCFLFRKIKSY